MTKLVSCFSSEEDPPRALRTGVLELCFKRYKIRIYRTSSNNTINIIISIFFVLNNNKWLFKAWCLWECPFCNYRGLSLFFRHYLLPFFILYYAFRSSVFMIIALFGYDYAELWITVIFSYNLGVVKSIFVARVLCIVYKNTWLFVHSVSLNWAAFRTVIKSFFLKTWVRSSLACISVCSLKPSRY